MSMSLVKMNFDSFALELVYYQLPYILELKRKEEVDSMRIHHMHTATRENITNVKCSVRLDYCEIQASQSEPSHSIQLTIMNATS